MKVIVNKNYVLFDVNTKVNKREFKATPLEFSFSEEYDGLTCKCVFSKIPATQDEEVTFYQQPIIDNKCYIPYEVMDGEGILIGVYGYSVDGEELLLRYSPKPKNLWFLEGSYYEGAETPEEILPSQFEQYVAYLNSQIARLNQIKIETEQLSDGVKISVTNADGETTETEVYNGEAGPQGPQGEPGSGISGKIYNFVEEGYYEVSYTSGSQFEMATDLLDDIKNDRCFTASLVRPLYIATGQDGLKGFTFVNYELDTSSLVLNFSYSGEIGDYFDSINRPGLKTTSVTITLTNGEVSSITFPYMDQTVKRYLSTINSDAYTPTENYHPSTKKYVDDSLSTKQDTLVSGTNIKTINSKDITGSGNVDIVQVSTLPTASSDNVGVIYQYIGITTTDYTQGYFYQCVENSGTYSWENIQVQEGSSGGSQSSFVFRYGEASATSIATAQQVIDYYNNYGVFPTIYYTSTNNSSYAAYNSYYSVRLNGYTASSRRYEFQVYKIVGVSSQYSGGNTLGCYGKIYIILNSDNLTVSSVTLPNSLYTSNNQVREYTIPILYKRGNAMSSIQSYLDADSVLPINNSEAFTPTGDYNPATKKYVDDNLSSLTGYDATKTQVLKNVNGTLTWVDEV